MYDKKNKLQYHLSRNFYSQIKPQIEKRYIFRLHRREKRSATDERPLALSSAARCLVSPLNAARRALRTVNARAYRTGIITVEVAPGSGNPRSFGRTRA